MKIEPIESLADHTTFKIGGRAEFFCRAESLEDLREALEFSKSKKIPFLILGGGSNVLVSDKSFDGLVIKLEMKGIEREEKNGEVFVTAWAGEDWDGLVAQTVEWGLWGLENLSLIPGTVGAAPVQNIGAYGVEVMSVIESVRAIDSNTGKEKVFSNRECEFSYRDSAFKRPENKKWVIVSVAFRLSKDPKPNLSYKDLREFFKARQNPSLDEIREAVIAIRRAKFPDLTETGTAGSFWKNPIISKDHYDDILKMYPGIPSFPASEGKVKVPLAWILDNVLKLKGFEMGKAYLYEKQPLVLAARKEASEAHVKALADHVAKAVFEATGIVIEPEVQFVG